jgi:peroxiredoxin
MLIRQVATSLGAALVGVFNVATHKPRPTKALKPGDVAPDFSLTGSDGRVHRLGDLKGRPVVLAWFPKAFTGG